MKQVFAAVDIGKDFTSITKFDTLGSIVEVIVKNAFVLAGVITFFLLVFAGFGMIAAAGSGDTKKLEAGKKTITGAVIGLVVIVGSFWIIQILETLTGLRGQLLPTLK